MSPIEVRLTHPPRLQRSWREGPARSSIEGASASVKPVRREEWDHVVECWARLTRPCRATGPSRIAADRHDDDRHDADRHRKHFGIGHQSQLLGLELIVDGAR
jgi:hypothetical protein